MGQLPVLQTKRLLLRGIDVNDITPEYIQWLNDPDVTRFLEIRFVPQTPERVREYIVAKQADSDHSQHFGVFDQNGSRLVGTVTLPAINWNHKFAEISFVIGHPEAQGKGYGAEAVYAVTQYAFQKCGLEKLYAGYYDGHVASAKVLTKNGFQVEGRIRKKFINREGIRVDHIIVGLLASDFQVNPTYLPDSI
jgi:RimJ/RimL family protein N-acetyltransferase